MIPKNAKTILSKKYREYKKIDFKKLSLKVHIKINGLSFASKNDNVHKVNLPLSRHTSMQYSKSQTFTSMSGVKAATAVVMHFTSNPVKLKNPLFLTLQ